ncbi:MAG: response regulator transcription factor [Chloroflexi bacterium]|nr:response regulator transcription factor [Chloroflexota bacterium]
MSDTDAISEPIRIVLAEDHWLMREGTRHILEQCPDFKVTGEAEDGQQALELIQRTQPDIAILDIRMPKLTGIEVVRRMKEVSPNTKALMLTAYDDDDYILALIEAGALGYLLKTARPNELIDAVRQVNAGEPVLHPAIAMKVARLWARRRDATRAQSAQSASEELSQREWEVLQLAANGFRNKAIADKLSLSVRTIEGHFRSIFAKLGVSSRVEAVLYALSHQTATQESQKKT